MNNPSPLIPQGATPPRGKSSLYFKVLMILTIHVVVIGGMLLQGCKDTSTKDLSKQDSTVAPIADTTPGTTAPTGASAATTVTPADVPTTLNPSLTNGYAGTAPSATPAIASTPTTGVIPTAKSTDLATPAPQGEAKEYVIIRGDTLAAIAHKNSVSLKALTEANPNVNARKLQIGQKLQIPAGATAVAAASTSGATPAATGDVAAPEGSTYVVKSGDTLTKIAKAHGTSFKRIMAMNDLKSTSIRAGQKLKMPAPKASTAEPSTGTAPATASAAPTTAPVRMTAAAPATTAPVAAN